MATISKYETQPGSKRYRVRWRDPNGKQKSKSFDRWTNANNFKVKLEHEMRDGSYVQPDKRTVKQFLAQWFEIHKQSLQHNTIIGYKYNIGHINSRIGDVYLQRLTAGDIETMYKDLSHLSGKYLQAIHSTLNLALKYATKKRFLSNNPCDDVDRPKKTKYQASFVRPSNVHKYLDLYKDAWIYPAVAIALFCGLRRGELLALRWRDINYKHKEITVKYSVVEIDGELISKTPKSGLQRTVNMPSDLIKVLKAHKKKQSENQLLLGENYITYGDDDKNEFLITEDNGKRPAPSYISRFFNRRMKSSDLPHVRFHDLRHTAASLMILEGASLKTVAEVMGHSSIKITADVYAHVIEESKKKAADSLNKYFHRV